jgi:dUTPase
MTKPRILHVYHTKNPDNLIRSTPSSAASGFDLSCETLVKRGFHTNNCNTFLYDTHVKAKVEGPNGLSEPFDMTLRSSGPAKTGCVLANALGIFDLDYQGTVMVNLVPIYPLPCPIIGIGSTSETHVQLLAHNRLPFSEVVVYQNDADWAALLERLQNTSDRGGGFGSSDQSIN